MSETSNTENYCKNCNHTFTKQYCNGCGQKNAHRITIPHLGHEVMHATLHADKGIFPFMKRILVSPGIMAKEYIDGKRKTFNPMQFLMLSIAFVILMMTLTHFYERVELWEAQSISADQSAAQAKMQEKLKGFNTFIKKNGNLMVLFLMPIFAFFGSLLFRKRNNNYAEHLMISVFAICLSNMLTAIMLTTYYFLGVGVTPIVVSTLAITVFSFFLTYKQFYQLAWFQAVWRSITVYSLTMIVYVILAFVVTVFILVFT